MKKLTRAIAIAAIAATGVFAVRSWGRFVHDEHLVGPYRLIAVDVDHQMSVCYDLGSDAVGRINDTVFAVGWNQHYVVAKQHPKNNRQLTRYFYLDMERDGPHADPSDSVAGPLSESEFAAKKVELGLPDFTRVMRTLE